MLCVCVCRELYARERERERDAESHVTLRDFHQNFSESFCSIAEFQFFFCKKMRI